MCGGPRMHCLEYDTPDPAALAGEEHPTVAAFNQNSLTFVTAMGNKLKVCVYVCVCVRLYVCVCVSVSVSVSASVSLCLCVPPPPSIAFFPHCITAPVCRSGTLRRGAWPGCTTTWCLATSRGSHLGRRGGSFLWPTVTAACPCFRFKPGGD